MSNSSEIHDLESLQLLSIEDLNREYCFVVPEYQRGYRWTADMAKELLEDIHEFAQPERDDKDYYCLQPLVLKKLSGDNKYEVIDGQQRLTTIAMCLEAAGEECNFTLSYKRHKCEFKDIPPDSFDGMFIEDVKKMLRDDDETENLFESFKKMLSQVKFIIYPCSEDKNAYELFHRINTGKIPLTDAELIKAHLLVNSQNREQVALEWDAIENRLQEYSFWSFICNNPKYINRIEYLFNVRLSNQKTEEHSCFSAYREVLKTGDNKAAQAEQAAAFWRDIKQSFHYFEEWYAQSFYYHMVGYLLHSKEGNAENLVRDLLEEAKEFTKKDDFQDHLREQVRGSIGVSLDKLHELQYPADSKRIREVLLLHNLLTLIEQAQEQGKDITERFDFGWFDATKRDIEHIHSQTQDDEEVYTDIIRYYLYPDKPSIKLNEITSEELSVRIEGRNSSKEYNALLAVHKLIYPDNGDNQFSSEEEAKKTYDEYDKFFGNNLGDRDGIGNLALLNSSINRGYGNAPFRIKREIITNNLKSGVQIPVCTRNVFLKFYCSSTENNYWGEADAKAYLEDIQVKLAKLWKLESNHE